MPYNPENSPTRKYVIQTARLNKLRLNEAQMKTAIEAVDHLMQEMNTDKLSDYMLGLLVKAAVQVEDEA